jgi:WD40 repeat protein
MGTPQYMSPEQALGQVSSMDARSDIFSLGGILYAILTLRPPVEGKDVWEVIEKVSTARISAPTTYGATTTGKDRSGAKGQVLEAKKITPLPHMPGGRVPNALSAVAMKALTLDKAKRYQDITAFSADIEAYQGGFATTAENAGAMKQLVLLAKRHKGVTAALTVMLLLSVAFVIKVMASERAARAAEVVAVEKGEAARRSAAEANLALTEAALREANGPLMQAALKAVPEDLRDPTWRYLMAQSDTSIAQPSAAYGPLSHLAADPVRPGVFAVWTGGGKIHLLDVRHGTKLLEFATPFDPQINDGVSAIAFSPDGERIAIGRAGAASKGGIVIHSARDGKKLQEWAAPFTSRTTFSFSPDGKILLQGNLDKVSKSPMLLNAWDASSGSLLWTFTFKDSVGMLGVFTPDSQQVVAYANGKVSLLSASDGSLVRPLGNWVLRSMAAHPKGNRVVLGGEDGIIRGVSLADAKVIFEFRPQKTPILQLAFTPDGARFASVAVLKDGRQAIEVWDAATGAPLQFLLGGSGPVTAAGVHPISGELLVTGPNPHVWSLAGSKWNLRGIGWARAAFWGNDDQIFAPRADGVGALHSLQGGTPNMLWPISGSAWFRVNVSADGRFALAGPTNKDIPMSLFKNPGTQVEMVATFTPPEFRRLVRLSPTGDRVVSVADYKVEVNVYDTTSGKSLVRPDLGGLSRVNDIGWSSDGRKLLGLVTAKSDRGNEGSEERILVWDASSGKILQSATNATAMDVIALSPDGRRFAEAGADKKVRIRDAATLALQQEFRAHDAGITALAWHPTKSILASASEDLSIRVWDLDTGARLEDLHGFLAPPTELNFSPTGKRLAAAVSDEGTRIWELPTRQKPAPTVENPPAAPLTPEMIADGWEDLLARLTPAEVGKTGNGWTLKDGELFSPNTKYAMLPLPGELSGTSYQVRVRMRQLPAKDVFYIRLPIADRMCGFLLEGRLKGIYTCLYMVDGKSGKDLPGAVEGKQVNDTAPHNLEVTVRLDGANATVTVTLDGRPLYEWTGPTVTLQQAKVWTTTQPGALALGTYAGGWAVSEVRVKRLSSPSAMGTKPAVPAGPPARVFKTGEWIPPAPSQEPLRKQGAFVEVSRDAEYHVQPLALERVNKGIQQLLAALPEGQKLEWAFHTPFKPEADQPHIIIRLKKPANLRQVAVENRRLAESHERAKGLTLWLSADGQEWSQVWQAESPQAEWLIDLGAGQQAQYLKLGLPGKGVLHLREVVVYGDASP